MVMLNKNRIVIYRMNLMDILQYVAIVVLAIFAFSVIRNLYFTQTSIVEGLENKSNTSTSKKINTLIASLNTLTEEMDETLLMSKYKKDYEDILLLQDEIVSKSILELITQNNLTSSKNNDVLTAINNLQNVKLAINDTMSYLDDQ